MSRKARLDEPQRRQLVDYIENTLRHPPGRQDNATVQGERQP